MQVRYTKVFELSKNLYELNAPIVISAGVLLKDNQTNNILLQFKFKNIVNKIIKAIRISIIVYDITGKQLDDIIHYEYLDLYDGRDCSFGQKIPIKISNNSVRSFDVKVDNVIFEDNSIWESDGAELIPLKEAKLLSEVFHDYELLKQYKLDYGKLCDYEFIKDRDIWICSCGKLNKSYETTCFNCGCSLESLENLDITKLKEKAEINREIETKKIRKGLIALIVAIILILMIVIPTSYVTKNKEYDSAIALMSTNPYVASKKFEKLGNFKDSISKLKESKILYYITNPGKAISDNDIRYFDRIYGDKIENEITGHWVMLVGKDFVANSRISFDRSKIDSRYASKPTWTVKLPDGSENLMSLNIKNGHLYVDDYAIDVIKMDDDVFLFYHTASDYIICIRSGSEWAKYRINNKYNK